MSKSQAIRGNFLFFQGSTGGGTQPGIAIYQTLDKLDCSSMLFCACLARKTVEIRGKTAELAATPVILEATISETANDKAFWFPVTGDIVAPGIFTMEIGAGAAQKLFYEPEITWLRIRAKSLNGVGTFPPSIGATMAGIYNGDSWEERVKATALGRPARNTDYQAV